MTIWRKKITFLLMNPQQQFNRLTLSLLSFQLILESLKDELKILSWFGTVLLCLSDIIDVDSLVGYWLCSLIFMMAVKKTPSKLLLCD